MKVATWIEEFNSAASHWGIERFAEWLRDGAAKLSNKDDEARALAFLPLLLDGQSDAADQVLSAINDLPETNYHRACLGLTSLAHTIPTRASPTYVEFLFKLAGTLRPVGFLEVFREFTSRQIIADTAHIWMSVVRTGMISLCNYPYSDQLDEVVASLRSMTAWEPALARHYILARLKARPEDWLTVLDEFEDDIVNLRDNSHAQLLLLLRQIVKCVRPHRIVEGLPELIDGRFRRLNWIPDELVGGGGKVLMVDSDFQFRFGNTKIRTDIFRDDLSDERQQAYISFIYRKNPPARLTPKEAQQRILKAVVEVAA